MSGKSLLFFLGLVVSACACAKPTPPPTLPHDGATVVFLDNHLPSGFEVIGATVTMDGETAPASADLASLFHAKLPEGHHSLELELKVRVPCGLTAEPYERLTAKVSRSFEVGPNGGLVYLDAFSESAWLNPAERVHLLVSLRGLREGRWTFGRSKEAREACGRLDPMQRSRCVVDRLVELSRSRHDVESLMCLKDRLEMIDAVIADVDRSVHGEQPESRTSDGKLVAPALLGARAGELERDAELCTVEDLSWMTEPTVTSDRSACAKYDEPLSRR